MVEEKKILIIRLSSFGDIILTFPLVNLLKNKFPNCKISFAIKEKYSELISINPLIDNTLIVKDGELSSSKAHISSENYDICIDLQNNAKSRYLTSSYKNVYRYHKNNFKKFLLVRFKINFFKEIIPVYKKYINSVSNLIPLIENDKDYTPSNLKYSQVNEIEGRYVLIAPSSRHFTKTYPKEKFVEFIRNNPDSQFVIVGDDSAEDMNICSFIESQTENTINLCGKLNFSQLSGIIIHADRIICNDSGIMHLAEALGKNVTAIFGSTVKEFGFFPQLKDSFVIENIGLECRPCSHTGLPACPLKHFKCMNDISLH